MNGAYIIIFLSFFNRISSICQYKNKGPGKNPGPRIFLYRVYVRLWKGLPIAPYMVCRHSLVKLAGSEIARSERIFRSIATPFLVRPAMNLL